MRLYIENGERERATVSTNNEHRTSDCLESLGTTRTIDHDHIRRDDVFAFRLNSTSWTLLPAVARQSETRSSVMATATQPGRSLPVNFAN